jgi:hypothetical protein
MSRSRLLTFAASLSLSPYAGASAAVPWQVAR